MPPEPEEIQNDTLYRQKPLCVNRRLETAHLSLTLTTRLMRHLRSVVRVARSDMLHRRHHTPVRGPVASEFVGDQPSGFAPLSFQQLAEESLGSIGASSTLDQDIDHVTVLVHSAPEIVPSTLDVHEELVEVPGIAQTTASTPKLPSVVRTKFPTPLPNRLVGDDDPALGQKIFDITEAQAEPMIEPDGVADDLRRKAMSVVALPIVAHRRTVPGASLS